jgi:hypothetical protein
MANGLETQIFSFFSNIFKVPEAWLGFPAFITNIIIPVVLMSYALYHLFQKIRIFGYHTGVYAVLSVIISLFLIPLGPLVAIVAAGFIGMFALTTWTSRIIFIAILIALYFIVIPYLSTIRF